MRMAGLHIAYVNAVQAQCRQARGKTARRFAMLRGEDFTQTTGFEHRIGALAPVVEIPGDHHRGIAGQGIQALGEQLQLRGAMAFA